MVSKQLCLLYIHVQVDGAVEQKQEAKWLLVTRFDDDF